MTTGAPTLSLGDFPTLVRRVFGSNPLRTEGDILALGYSPDGTLLSVEDPGLLRRWDLSTQQQLSSHALEELAVHWAFSRDGQFLAAGNSDVTLWDTASGEVVNTWSHPSWVTAVAFDSSGDVLATGHDDGIVRLWDTGTGEQLQELVGHPLPVSALAFNGDSKQLASAGEDRTIRLWEVNRGVMLGSLFGHTDRVPGLAWHPDGVRLLSAGWDTTARVWDTTTFQPIILLNAHAGQVFAFALSDDGQRLACADSSNTVHLWDLNGYRLLGSLRDRAAGEVRCLAFAPDNRRLVFGGIERLIYVWDTGRQHAEEDRLYDPQRQRTVVALGDGGRRLYSASSGTIPRLWDTHTGQPLPTWPEAGPICSFAVSPNGHWAVGSLAPPAPSQEGQTPLALWNAHSGERVAMADEERGPVTTLVFSPDSKLLATASYQSSNVWLWDLPALEPYLLINNAAEGCAVESVAFHPDGRHLAIAGIDCLSTSGRDGQVDLYSLTDKQVTATLPGGALCVAFAPDGKRLATATLRGTIRIYDMTTRQLIAELSGHTDLINGLAWSPDGRLLASLSDDHTVRLWDASTLAPRSVLPLDTQGKSLAFSPDSRWLCTGNANGSCYQLEVGQLLTDAPADLA
jgi:WD40 repeat protein